MILHSLAGRRAVVVFLATTFTFSVPTAPAPGQAVRRKPASPRRTTLPDGPWDPAITEAFLDDAFAALSGERPSFGSADPTSRADADTGSTDPTDEGMRWSEVVSEGTLTDEVKDMAVRLTEACASPSTFAGGGFQLARRSFGSLAVAFGVIAASSDDLRWRADAPAARDLFARAGRSCSTGSQAAFTEAKARLDDLRTMLEGRSLPGPVMPLDRLRWSDLTDRTVLMQRLEEALAAARPAVASDREMPRQLERTVHAAELIALIGELIQRPDFEDHDDDAYRGHAASMRDAGRQLRAACREGDAAAARAAVGRIEKACVACHGDYRG